MRTKHLILSLIAFMAIFLASCSEQQPMMGTEVNGTQTFTFSLTTDGQAQTRAAAPVVAGYRLKYFLQVLDADGTPITGSSTNNETGTFNVSLPVGAAYTCLFWAHYIPESSGDNEFFNTGDLKAVTLKQHLTGADHCQAFSGTASIAADQAAGSNQTVLLKRAVAQVNIKTDTKMAGYSKLTARYTDVPNTFNVQDNTVAATGSITTPSAFEVTTFPADAGADGKFTYQSAYFLASADGVGSMLKLEINTYNSVSNNPIQTLTIANVTTKKNYKTNILASFDPANLAHTYNLSFEDWNAKAIIPPSLWDGVIPAADASYAFGGGDGSSAENAYIIASAADLAQLTANVNAGTTYAGKYFKQTVDIDLNNHEWTPIGDYSKAFEGKFNGGHHKVMQLTVTSTTTNDNAIGLFGYAKDGIIENLHVSGTVKNTASSGTSYAGGVVGQSESNIKACSFEGSVSNSSSAGYAAGIAGHGGYDYKSLFGCINRGAINCENFAAGITAYIEGGIMACYNEGTITANGKAGGITYNINNGGFFSITACYNIGEIKATGSGTAGAIAAMAEGINKAKECYYAKAYGSEPIADEILFDETAWPNGAKVDDGTSDNLWRVDLNPDGTYKRDASTNYKYQECKIWKSVGAWNSDEALRAYPKLWWED